MATLKYRYDFFIAALKHFYFHALYHFNTYFSFIDAIMPSAMLIAMRLY